MSGVPLSLAGMIVLLMVSWGKPWHAVGFAIYGTSLMLLYAASALYHLTPCEPHQVKKLLVFDQCAIYCLIAGTYTPLCLVNLRGPWGYGLLAVVWGIALVGIVLRIGWQSAPPWLCVALYLVLGWLCMTVIGPLVQALPGGGLGWLTAGGVLYTVGAVVFATKWPRLWPGRFGSHDLWHCFVLAGSACHWVMMLGWVAPAR